MRRRNPKPGPRRWVRRGLALLLAAAGLYVYLVETEVKPRVEELAEYECRAIVVQAMNEAVSAEMQRTPALYQDLYTLTYAPNGALCAVRADTAALNRAQLALVDAVQQALAALSARSWTFPLGSLSGWSVLGGLGPDWEMQLQPRGYVEGRMEEEAESLSINRTRYTVSLALQVTINMVLDGKHSTAVVAERIPVSSLLLEGEVPTYYSGG
ncbi:MAG: sporulation protein YunB [Gemmiger sp.]